MEKKPLEIEEIRWQRTAVRQLPSAIFQCKNLKTLVIDRCGLEALPEEIGQLDSLEELVIESNSVETLPKALVNLNQLKKVAITHNQLTEFPLALLKHPTLEILDLKLNKISEIPDFSTVNTTLKKLSVSSSELKSIGTSLQNLQALEILEISYGTLTELPVELGELTNLKQLSFHWNQVKTLPVCIRKLSNLTQLNFDKTGITELPEWIRELKNLQIITFCADPNIPRFTTFPQQLAPLIRTATIRGLNGIYPQLTYKDNERLWKQIKTKNGTPEDDLRYLRLFTGDERIETYSTEQIIADLVKTKEAFVVQNAIQHLTKDSLAQNPIKAGSELALLGKLEMNDVRNVKKRLKDAGVSLMKSPTEKTTHWYISAKIIGEYTTEFAHLPFVNSEQLLRSLDDLKPQYLVEDKENLPENIENIKRFLFASEESSQLLAFELIKSGGLPKELLTDVFYLFHTTENAKIRTKACNVVKKYASPQLQKGLSFRHKIKNIHNNQHHFKNFWKQVVEGTELNDLQILLYMVRDYGTNPCCAMTPLLNHPDAKLEEIAEYVGTKGKLRLFWESHAKLIPFLKKCQNLEELELHDMRFEQLPSTIFQLKSLKSLLLKSISVKEIKIPNIDVSSLEYLSLIVNEAEKISNLSKLNNLKELHLFANFKGDLSNVIRGLVNLKKLRIAGTETQFLSFDGLKSCVNLENLEIRCRQLSELPKELSDLKNLRELTLIGTSLQQFPMVLTLLPALRKIKVENPRSDETRNLLLQNKHLLHPQLVLQ